MIRYKQLITLNLLDSETKNSIGKIFDVAYSDDYKRIDYLIVKNDNLFKSKISIPYKDIKFSNDNGTIYMVDLNTLKNRFDEDNIRKFKFIDKEIRVEDGECVGYIKDIVINKDDGSLEGFIITEGLIEDLLRGRNYIPFLKKTYIKEDAIYIPYKYLI